MSLFCEICGRTDDEVRIIQSKKYGKNLCPTHYRQLTNSSTAANNNISGNTIKVTRRPRSYVFTFDEKDLDLIKSYKWSPRIYKGKCYLVDSSGHFLVNMLLKNDNIDNIYFADSEFDYRRSNIFVRDSKDKKIKFNKLGFNHVYKRDGLYQVEFYKKKIRIKSKKFKRLELAVYYEYLIQGLYFDEFEAVDKYLLEQLNRLSITDREEIEEYFLKKFCPETYQQSFTRTFVRKGEQWEMYKRYIYYKKHVKDYDCIRESRSITEVQKRQLPTESDS